VARQEYFHDDTAPVPNSMSPTAFAVVRDDRGWILLVRRSDSGNWELPGGRVELGEDAAIAAEREVVDESGVMITVSRLAGIYSDPGHVMVYPSTGEARQQFAASTPVASRANPIPTTTRPAKPPGSTLPPRRTTDPPEHVAADRPGHQRT
jgi:ADP-ribose pyrophosphatase YjhB (NUDIX family)